MNGGKEPEHEAEQANRAIDREWGASDNKSNATPDEDPHLHSRTANLVHGYADLQTEETSAAGEEQRPVDEDDDRRKSF